MKQLDKGHVVAMLRSIEAFLLLNPMNHGLAVAVGTHAMLIEFATTEREAANAARDAAVFFSAQAKDHPLWSVNGQLFSAGQVMAGQLAGQGAREARQTEAW